MNPAKLYPYGQYLEENPYQVEEAVNRIRTEIQRRKDEQQFRINREIERRQAQLYLNLRNHLITKIQKKSAKWQREIILRTRNGQEPKIFLWNSEYLWTPKFLQNYTPNQILAVLRKFIQDEGDWVRMILKHSNLQITAHNYWGVVYLAVHW